MRKLKTAVLAVIGVTIAVLFILRMQYTDNGEIETLDLSLYGLTDGIGLEKGDTIEGIYVTVPDSIEVSGIISVSSDPDIAYLQLDRDSISEDRLLTAKLITVSEGVAEIFVRSSDGEMISDKYSICVCAAEGRVGTDGTSQAVLSSEVRESGTVYVTANGSKYHLSIKCAGEKAVQMTLEESAQKGYAPCKNCAMNK